MPPKPSYADRVYTTDVVAYPGTVHVGNDKNFTPVIEKALELGGYTPNQEFTGINGGHTVTTGFVHDTILGVADPGDQCGEIRCYPAFLPGGRL